MKYISLKKYKYQLVGDEKVKLTEWFGKFVKNDWVSLNGNHIIIRDKYNWDGPSGPTVDTKNSMRASLVHDALYQLIRIGQLDKRYRKKADKVLYMKDGQIDQAKKFKSLVTH